MKKQTQCGFFYNIKCKTIYSDPPGFLKIEDMPKLKKESPVTMSKQNLAKLLAYRSNFGRDMRQRAVRADTTKDTPGTLPMYMYIQKNKSNYTPATFSCIVAAQQNVQKENVKHVVEQSSENKILHSLIFYHKSQNEIILVKEKRNNEVSGDVFEQSHEDCFTFSFNGESKTVDSHDCVEVTDDVCITERMIRLSYIPP